jgi:single-stranded-DNA-specific exonuclease
MGAVCKIIPVEAEGPRGPYLGVAASARGLAWRERQDASAAQIAVAISQRHGLPELLGRVLAARGIGLSDVPVFLDPTIKALMPDPSTVRDMDKGAARLADAILRREPIAVFGDYDVDGACSAALMHRFLAAHGLAARIYIPDRMTEGYGPTSAPSRLGREGAIHPPSTAAPPACPAGAPRSAPGDRRDHHQADERLPAVCAVVNPNRQDACRAGQCAPPAWSLLVATARELRRRRRVGQTGIGGSAPFDLLELLDLVALATVCDQPLPCRTSRAYVAKGLQAMRLRRNPGLRALSDAAGLAVPPTPYHLGFVLGPRINAGGRIGDSGLGARLLALGDETVAAHRRAIDGSTASAGEGDAGGGCTPSGWGGRR